MGNRTCLLLFCLLNWLQASYMLPHLASKPRVCVIGAGYSGLATARHMIGYGLNLTVFEASNYIGGTWRYTPRVGTDEYGVPLFTSAYKNLRTNSFYQTMEFPDYPFPVGPISSFLSGPCVYKYLEGYTKQFNLEKYVQFRSLVTNVEKVGDNWKVTYMKTDTKQNVSEDCGFVVVANGEYTAPNLPYFEKQEDFKGKMLHSHDFRDPEEYRGLRVLVVGAGPSAFDLAENLVNVTSMFIHSHHLVVDVQKIYGNYKHKPDIKHFTSTGAVFVDDSTEEFDVAILCTGYSYSFPFLNYQSSGVTWTEKYIMPLYNHLININHPTMTFVGAAKYTLGLVRDRQGHYSAQLAAGLIELPSKDEMFQQWFNHAKDKTPKEINLIGYENTDIYTGPLLHGTDIPRIPLVFSNILRDQEPAWYSQFLTYRNYQINILNDSDFEVVPALGKKTCPFEV